MEDGIVEAENMVNPTTRGYKRKEHDEEEIENTKTGPIRSFISNLVSGEDKDDAKKDEENGVLAHIMSNFVSPPKSGENNFESENGGSEIRSEVDGDGKRVFGNFISKFLHQSEDEDEKLSGVSIEESKEVKADQKEGGFISNIVSHLPTSLPDDAAFSTDEASILIHSIIHD